MKRMLLLLSVLSLPVFSADLPPDTVERLKKIYPDQSENYIYQRLENAETAFEKWRSFPPYYYDLFARINKVHTGGKERKGFCAGDAHIENFGFLYTNQAHFSLNDLDDAAPCSLDADVLRLYVGIRLSGSQISGKEFIAAYRSGLSATTRELPQPLIKLFKASSQGQTKLTKKYQEQLKSPKCRGEFEELSSAEKQMIKEFMDTENKAMLKACSRTKDAGGSAGLKRFVVFHKSGNENEAFELKPLVRPAPLVYQEISISRRKELFQQAMRIFFNESFNELYYPIVIKGTLYQRRPLFAGNVAVEKKDFLSEELNQVLLFEAFTLGVYHQLSNKEPFRYTEESFEAEAKEIESTWRKEFAE